MRTRTRALATLGGVAACASLVACGGSGSSDKVSAASLDSRLLPPSLLRGYSRQRTFDWSDPVNLVGEGIRLPEASHPAAAVKVLDEAGLKGAAGELFTQGRPPEENQVTNGVIKLKSADGAKQVRDFLHRQDLQQPCFTACIYTPRNLPVPGVPTGVGVQQVPHIPPPPGGGKVVPGQGPPVNYFVEFTVGPYLYFGNANGSPGDAARVVGLTKRYYQRVSKLSG